METLTDLFTIGEAVSILRALAAREKDTAKPAQKLSDRELIALVKVLELLHSLGDRK